MVLDTEGALQPLRLGIPRVLSPLDPSPFVELEMPLLATVLCPTPQVLGREPEGGRLRPDDGVAAREGKPIREETPRLLLRDDVPETCVSSVVRHGSNIMGQDSGPSSREVRQLRRKRRVVGSDEEREPPRCRSVQPLDDTRQAVDVPAGPAAIVRLVPRVTARTLR